MIENPCLLFIEAFMKVLEKDAEERGARRKKARAEATAFKDEGNTAFKSGDYEKAVDLYSKVCGTNYFTVYQHTKQPKLHLPCDLHITGGLKWSVTQEFFVQWQLMSLIIHICFFQGLDKLKDFKELWTNRAQAYIRLGKFTEALSDCDWAQRSDENYVKAYVLQAKAHLGLFEYDKAIEVYKQAKEIDSSKENMINGKHLFSCTSSLYRKDYLFHYNRYLEVENKTIIKNHQTYKWLLKWNV